MEIIKLDSKIVKIVENVLSKGDRVEIIPVKDGVRIVKIKRENIK